MKNYFNHRNFVKRQSVTFVEVMITYYDFIQLMVHSNINMDEDGLLQPGIRDMMIVKIPLVSLVRCLSFSGLFSKYCLILL